jgi:hypothetical protein
MKHRMMFLVVVAIMMMAITSAGAAPTIKVYDGASYVGAIAAYSGAESGADNYNYSIPAWSSTGPTNGPALVDDQGSIFFYDGSDGLHFTVIFSKYNDNGSAGSADWDMTVTNSTVVPSIQLSDDDEGDRLADELTGSFSGDWEWQVARTDGGVIGPLGGVKWTVDVTQNSYSGLSTLIAADANGNDISLTLGNNLKFQAVPEASTMLMLGMGLVGGLVAYRRRRK